MTRQSACHDMSEDNGPAVLFFYLLLVLVVAARGATPLPHRLLRRPPASRRISFASRWGPGCNRPLVSRCWYCLEGRCELILALALRNQWQVGESRFASCR